MGLSDVVAVLWITVFATGFVLGKPARPAISGAAPFVGTALRGAARRGPAGC